MPHARDVVGRVSFHPIGEPQRVQRDVAELQLLDLRNDLLLDPAKSTRLNRLPRTERHAGDGHEHDRNQHRRPAPGLIARA